MNRRIECLSKSGVEEFSATLRVAFNSTLGGDVGAWGRDPINGFKTEKVQKGYRQCGYLPQPPTSLLEWRPSGPRRVALNPSSGIQFVSATLLRSDGNSLGCSREGYPMRLRRCANEPCKYAKEPCRYEKEP